MWTVRGLTPDCAGMPAASSQPSKKGFLCSIGVRMEWLGVELRGETQDPLLGHFIRAAHEGLTYLQVLEKEPFRCRSHELPPGYAGSDGKAKRLELAPV